MIVVALAIGMCALVDVQFVESRLEFKGGVLAYECPDVDDDGRGDLVVVAREDDGRVLNVFLQTEGGAFARRADWRLTLPTDVVAYTFLDIRPEPGRELLLFTRNGVHSVSTTRPGLRDNVARELDVPVFPDLPDPSEVSRWLLADVSADGEAMLLIPTGGPSDGELTAFVRDDADGGSFRRQSSIPMPADLGGEVGSRFGFLGDSAHVNVDVALPRFFPGAPSSMPRFDKRNFLSHSESRALPALVDWDGDGRRDAIVVDGEALRIYLNDADAGFCDQPQRLPIAALSESGGADKADLRFADVDGDGVVELVVEHEESGGLSRDHVLLLISRDRDGRPAAVPTARIKLAATDVKFRLHDVNGDGLQDVVARVVDIPTGITTLAGIRIELSLLVFLGGQTKAGQPTFSRHPDLAYERTLRPEEMTRARESFILDLSGDLSGDGLHDLMLLQPDGLLEIIPMIGRGADLEFASEPFSSYRPVRSVRGAAAETLSGDGIEDLVLRHEDALTVFVSKSSGDSRQGGDR